MLIRRAAIDDVPAICAVCSAGWRDTYRDIHSPEHVERVVGKYYTTARVASELPPSTGWNGWYVAEHEGEILGAGGGGCAKPGVCELYVLYVAPGSRYRGIGTALLATITEEMLAQGAVEQFVSVHPNNAKGLPFYRARGFTVFGRRGGEGAYADAHLLRRPLYSPSDKNFGAFQMKL